MPEWLIGLIGVVVGSFLTAAKDWIFSYWTTRKKAYYLAVRIVCILDRFIDRCVDASEDEFVDNETQPYMACGPIPEVPELPNDVDWKSIDANLSYEILSLSSKVEFAKQSIRDASQFDGPPYDETNEKMKYEIATLGVLACDLSSKLRKKYEIPHRDNSPWSHDFEPCLHLHEMKESIEKSLKERGELPPEWGCAIKAKRKKGFLRKHLSKLPFTKRI